jgi:hypothetical protein
MLSLSASIHDWLIQPETRDANIRLKAAVRAHFDQFVKGEEIDDLYYMKRVSRRRDHHEFWDEVWSMRPDFNPRQRFLGAFFREDWFVVMTRKPREFFKYDGHWQSQIDLVRSVWDDLFPYRPRHRGNAFSDYVTSNAEHCDDRW